MNMEGIFCGSVGDGEGDQSEVRYVCPEWPHIIGMESSHGRLSIDVDIKKALRKELSSVRVISTPVEATCPFYSKRRSSVFEKQEAPPCKSVIFHVASKGGAVGGGDLGGVT